MGWKVVRREGRPERMRPFTRDLDGCLDKALGLMFAGDFRGAEALLATAQCKWPLSPRGCAWRDRSCH
jgi:hypothetical protein